MTDPISLSQALESAKAGYDIVKGLMAVKGAYEQVDLKAKIAELAEHLMEARTGLLDAQEEIIRLRAKIGELETAQQFRGKLALKQGVYWEEGDTKQPYCTRCFDADKKAIRLTKHPISHFGTWLCPQCKSGFK